MRHSIGVGVLSVFVASWLGLLAIVSFADEPTPPAPAAKLEELAKRLEATSRRIEAESRGARKSLDALAVKRRELETRATELDEKRRLLQAKEIALKAVIDAAKKLAGDKQAQAELAKAIEQLTADLAKLDPAPPPVDELLAKATALTKELELKIGEINRSIEQMKTEKAKLRAELNLIERSTAPVKAKMEEMKVAMAKLTDAIKAGGGINIGGKEFDFESLKEVSAELVKRYESLEGELKSLETTKPILDGALQRLQANIEHASGRLVELSYAQRSVESVRGIVTRSVEAKRSPLDMELRAIDDTLRSLQQKAQSLAD